MMLVHYEFSDAAKRMLKAIENILAKMELRIIILEGKKYLELHNQKGSYRKKDLM